MRHCNRLLAATLALSFACAGAEAETMNVSTKDGLTQIDNVPPLDWMSSGQTTYCGALSAAAGGMGIKTDYTQLMGDSALAFRLRWWRKDGGAGWCPSSPVGEFAPWSDRAAESIGLKVAYKVHMAGDQPAPEMAQYAGAVKQSIDAGRPVLVYATHLDMGVVYGYRDDGQTLLVRDYYKGKTPLEIKLAETKGLLGFIEKTGQPRDARERAVAALKAAVAEWRAPAEKWNSRPGPGKYLLGDAAYAEWIDNLENADKFTEAERKELFQPSWWTFCVLADARQSAAAYLRRTAPLFEGDARTALERAADHYAQSAKAAGRAFGEKDIFFGPWSQKTITDWTPEVRAAEADRLETLRHHDNLAIAEIEKAIKGQ